MSPFSWRVSTRLTQVRVYPWCLVSLLSPVTAFGQQAIVSLPSADVTPRGEFFVMQESQVRAWSPKPYWNTTHFWCFGLGYHAELAVTMLNVGVPSNPSASLANGFKVALPILTDELPRAEIKITTGTMALFSLQDRGYGYWFYSHLSGRLPRVRTRLSLGASQASQLLFERELTVIMAAAEQPLMGDKLNLVAEWFSGKHDLGNFIYGLAYHPNHSWIFVVGHKIPTSGPEFGANKMAAVGEIGWFFH